MGPDAFDYDLPPQLVAQQPAQRRSDARLLVVGAGSQLDDRRVTDLPALLPSDALVVVNASKVVPARLHATRADGRAFELLLCAPGADDGPGAEVTAWVRGAKRLRPDDRLQVGQLVLRYLGPHQTGPTGPTGPTSPTQPTGPSAPGPTGPTQPTDPAAPPGPPDPRARRFEVETGHVLQACRDHGAVPLPPYIRRPEGPDAHDAQRYQTVYAQREGSVAAPTAGLHLDETMLAKLDVVRIHLHVGPGTFLPMDVDDVSEHRVGAERVEVEAEAAERIEQARRDGRPIVAVGTTVTRTLETLAASGPIRPFHGLTDLVITPGFRFAAVTHLLTNFHLPRSSLLMLVCSFAGRRTVLDAYRHAVAHAYRFYSYGDAMLCTRSQPG